MKLFLQASLAAASILVLAACASGGGIVSTGPSDSPVHAQERMVIDAQYMAYVEHVARRRGVNVRWFNPPVKRVAGPGPEVAQESGSQ